MEALVVPAVLDSLDAITRYVLTAAEEARLEKKAAYRLRLAADELATNIITHGYDEAGLSGDIQVDARLDAGSLTITLEDSAAPFDPRQVKEVDSLDRSLEDRPIGGLGVFLVLKNVDEFRYEFENHKNRNILVMNRPAVHAGG